MSLDHTDIDRLVAAYREDYTPDVEAGLQRMHGRIGKVRPLRPRPSRFYRLAAVAAAAIVACVAALYLLIGTGRTTFENTDARIAEYSLPDGSRIVLQQGSRLSFEEDYNTAERRVQLEGQGYFEVVSDASRPFFVVYDNNSVRVTGTAFNVRASEQAFEVEVSEGSVELHVGEKSMAVKAMEFVTVAPDQPIEHGAAPNLNHHAWRTGTLKFDRTPISEVLTYFNDNWGIVCNWQVGVTCDYPVSGNFDSSDATAVLGDIAKLGGLSVRSTGEDGKHYELSGNCTF